MTKDRMEQLKEEMAKDYKTVKYKFWNKDDKITEDNEGEHETLTGVVVQPTITKAERKEQNTLSLIFTEVHQINNGIEKMKDDIALLKNCQILVQQSPRTNPGMRDKIKDLMAGIKSAGTKIKTKLQAFETMKEGAEAAINKVVDTQLILMRRAFNEVMDEYQQSLFLHRKICEDILKKQLAIVIQMLIRRIKCVPADRDVTQDELGAILDADDIAIFVDNYMRDTLEAKLRLQNAQDLHKEITAIEKEIQLLSEMFTDLSMHVARQGEIIDRIENHILNGSEKTNEAVKRISKLHRMVGKMRKRKFWIISILVGLCLLLLVIVASS